MSRQIEKSTVGTIKALGFDVYQVVQSGDRLQTWLFFTDGKNIGYLQAGRCGGLELSTVHVPNKDSGSGFALGETVLTRKALEYAFITAPNWAGSTDFNSVVKWASVEKFLQSQTLKHEKV